MSNARYIMMNNIYIVCASSDNFSTLKRNNSIGRDKNNYGNGIDNGNMVCSLYFVMIVAVDIANDVHSTLVCMKKNICM